MNSVATKSKALLSTLLLILAFAAHAHADWIKKPVKWMGPDKSKINAVYYPDYDMSLMSQDVTSASQQMVLTSQGTTSAIVIDSPPIDGFVPWVAINVTDERLPDLDSIFDATVESSVQGSYLTNDPANNYAIGLFDTGASASIISAYDSILVGIDDHPSMVTSNPVQISGVNSNAIAYVSQPMGLFTCGIGNINSSGELSDSNMVGLSNVALMIGDFYDSPNVPTVIGSPLAVYYDTVFNNSKTETVEFDSEIYSAPQINVYSKDTSAVEDHNNIIPLELRPLGATAVQYVPTLNFDTLEYEPSSPSIIIGTSSQSLFFIHSVDLYYGSNEAYDKDRFMLDTGAQVTVIGSRVAARLGLDPQNAEFQVEIEGATGEIQMIDGFYIDRLEIPALGKWLCFTEVPVILMDISSPEGGTLDGIIGMNLFNQLDFILRGGGMMLQDDPYLSFEIAGYNIADFNNDDSVNFYDFSLLASKWQTQQGQPSWQEAFDISNSPDGVINLNDLKVFAEKWLD